MKKLLIGLVTVILLGAGVSTLQRYTGVNLESAYKIGAFTYMMYEVMKVTCKKNSAEA